MTGILSCLRAAGTACVLAVGAFGGCSTTVDSLGCDQLDAGVDTGPDAIGEGGSDGGPTESSLRPLSPRSSYPNVFRDLLGKSEREISDKIDGAFKQLFHGDPDTRAIYYEDPDHPDQAEIRDIYHGDVRTEGVGLGMLITVELDKQQEFDKLWSYAKAVMAASGANAGYFDSWCDTLDPLTTTACVDPFGYQQFTMSLIFAHDRWGSDGAIDYEADALELLDVMRQKEDRNGGIVDGVTNTFDGETKLVFDVPNAKAAIFTRPSIEMPAYYQLWAEATGDDFWLDAADAGRAYIQLVAHARTGLTPVRAYFDGVSKEGWGYFGPEAYRTHLNVTLDAIWTDEGAWAAAESDLLISFFYSQGLTKYGTSYELDGTPILESRELALIFANGIAAVPATRAERVDFVQAVWDLNLPPGSVRYYPGLFGLLAFITMSGRMVVL